MPGPHAADYKVEIVDASGAPDMQVSIVGDQVVSLVGSSPGDVLVVSPDGQTLVTAPSSTPGAHASTHADGGSDEVTLATSQITGLDTALASFVTKALYDANSILIATADNTPAALTVGASTFVGRKAAGDVSAMSVAEAKTLLAFTEADIPNLATDLGLKAPLASPSFTGTVTLGEGVNLVLGTTTGSIIGTSTTQKLGFYNATPVVQPAGSTDVLASLVTLGLRGASSNPALNLGTGVITAGTTGVGALTSTSIVGTGTVALTGTMTVTDAVNVAVGTTTGTKIGTATSQKLGFFNATPVVQQLGNSDVLGSLVTLGFRAASSNPPLNLGTGTLTSGAQTIQGSMTLSDAANLILGTSTGTKIGTGTTQLLGFYNATPVAQIAGSTDVLAGLVTSGLRAASSNPPMNLGTGVLTAGGGVFKSAGSTSILIGDNNVAANQVLNIDAATANEAAIHFKKLNADKWEIYVPGSSNDFRFYDGTADRVSFQAGTAGISLGAGYGVTFSAANIVTDTTTGTKIGTGTTQKLGFFNATPVVQEAGTNDVLASLVTLGLRAASSNPPLNLGSGTLTCGAQTIQGNSTYSDAVNLIFNATTGTKIGTATSQKMGFYNATPIIQPVGASQAAVAVTGSTNVTPFGYTTAAQADAIVTLVNALRTALVNLGLIKGAA